MFWHLDFASLMVVSLSLRKREVVLCGMLRVLCSVVSVCCVMCNMLICKFVNVYVCGSVGP